MRFKHIFVERTNVSFDDALLSSLAPSSSTWFSAITAVYEQELLISITTQSLPSRYVFGGGRQCATLIVGFLSFVALVSY